MTITRTQPMTAEARFWALVQTLNWRADPDYESLEARLKKEYTEEEIEAFERTFNTLHLKLKKSLQNHWKAGKLNGVYYDSQDSFEDFTAHIVGSGKVAYRESLESLEAANRHGEGYVESFSYIF